MIGIEFNSKNNENLVDYLIKNINLDEYDFYISEYDIFHKYNESFIVEGLDLSIKQIEELINNDYGILSLKIEVYKKNTPKPVVITNKDFLNSECEYILLIIDCECVEIYFKENKFKELTMQYVEENNIKNEIKTLENDGRYHMFIWRNHESDINRS